jgi:redox-sensitive bicupin YhaK (pirin superfamily)
MTVDLRPATTRFRTSTGWLESYHSFSFGPYFDPANTSFGLLLAHNDELVAPGTGFGTHPHRDLEIVTWVLQGTLAHQDSSGHRGALHPGVAQLMSAGSGIRHSESNDGSQPLRYVQMWVQPDAPGLTPSYQQLAVDDRLSSGELVPIASGLPGHAGAAAIRLHQRDAGLSVARLGPGATVELPPAPYAHVFVALGTATLEGGGDLSTADAARLVDADGRRLKAGPDGAEVLVWEMHSGLGRGAAAGMIEPAGPDRRPT